MSYDSEWIRYYDEIYSTKDYGSEVDYVLSFLEDIKNAHILDIGCGTGNHSILMSKEAYQVTGIDPSPHMIEIATQKGVFDNLSFKRGYVNDIFVRRYTLVVSLFNVINQIKTFYEVDEFFRQASIRTVFGGYFIFDCWNQVATLLSKPLKKITCNDRMVFQCIPEVDEFNSKIILKNSILNTETHKSIRYDIDINLWQPSALRDILEKNGFEVEIYKTFTKEKASKEDYKIIFVNRKKNYVR